MESKVKLQDYLGKSIKELVKSKTITVAKRGLYPNINDYLYLTVEFQKEKEKVSLFLTKACAKNFKRGEKPGFLMLVETGPEKKIKLGMGSLEFTDELDEELDD